MAPIDEAIADLELREAGDNFSLQGIAKNIVYRIQHWAEGGTTRQALGQPGTPRNNYLAHNKRRDS
jgi:hypothetical protein